MKTSAKLKFIIGIIGVALLCFGLFLYLDYSMSRVDSTEAHLDSDTYTVGLDYSGIVTKQYIEEGSEIKTGDQLFEVRSQTLSDAIRSNEIAKSALLYTVKDDDSILISAAAPGRVQKINHREGAFVPANSQIAVIDIKDKLYINATYSLSVPDYARIRNGSKLAVIFPDGKHLEASIYDINLTTADKKTTTTIKGRFDNSQITTEVFSTGTPLKTTLQLSNDTLFNRIADGVRNLFQPKSGK